MSHKDKLLTKVNNIKHWMIGFHVTKEEHELYHRLTPEQKKLIRAILKTLIYRPDLLNESSYLFKLLTAKAVSPYVCPLCLTPYSSSVALKNHLRYEEHTTKCPICSKQFTSVDATIDHVCKKHNICVS